MSVRPGTKARFAWLLTATTTVSALAASLMIPIPFMGDQALFTVFARMMNEGATLYRQIWDVKQPGIFWFYQLAGRFSPDQIGAHLLDAAFWILASALLAIGIRPHLKRAWIAALFPLAGAAWYFLVADTNELTQVETLISPLLAGMVLLLAGRPGRRATPRATFAAGSLAGLIVVFKMLAGIVPLLVLAVSIYLWIRDDENWAVTVRGLIVPFAIGSIMPLLAVGIWAGAHGLLDVLRYTWFEYPPQMLQAQPRSPSRLVSSAFGFASSYATLVVLAAWHVIRPSGRGRRLTELTIAACVAALVVVLLQLWWSYLFFMLAAPLGMLALQGLDDLFDHRGRVAAIVAIIATLAVVPFGAKAWFKMTHFDGFTAPDLTWASNTRRAREIIKDVHFDKGARLYVLGDPLVLYLLKADQGIAINGWSPEFWNEHLWREVTRSLVDEPVEGLFLRDDLREMAKRRYPEFELAVLAKYSLAESTSEGQWMVPRPD